MCVRACLHVKCPWASYRPCKMMKWRDQRDCFEVEGSSESVCAHSESSVHLSPQSHTHLHAYMAVSYIHTHARTRWPTGIHTWTQSPPTCAPRWDMEGIRPLFSLDPRREALNPWPSLSKYLRQARSTHSLNQNSRGGDWVALSIWSLLYLSWTLYLRERSANFKAEFRVLSGALWPDVAKIPVFHTQSPGR